MIRGGVTRGVQPALALQEKEIIKAGGALNDRGVPVKLIVREKNSVGAHQDSVQASARQHHSAELILEEFISLRGT